jgi:hypothetical protein
MEPPSAVVPAQDREQPPVRDKLDEYLARLKDPKENLSWSKIKKECGVSTRKLHERMRGIQRHRVTLGRPTALSPEVEKAIADYIVRCRQLGFTKTRELVERDIIIPLASTQQEKYPFNIAANGQPLGPSRKWWRLFLQRHENELQVTRASPLACIHAAAANAQAFESVYASLRGRMDIPDNAVVLDETAIPDKCGWAPKVLSDRNRAPAYIPGGDIDQRHLTLVAACSAAGHMLPATYICAGESISEARALRQCRAAVVASTVSRSLRLAPGMED